MWSTVYIAASLATVGWAMFSGRPHLRDASCMLFWFCVLSNAARAFWGQYAATSLYPIMDIIGLSVTATVYTKHGDKWAMVLSFLFLAQIAAHVAFLGQEHADNYYYAICLNILFSLQLLTVVAAGAPYVWDRVRDCLVVPHQGGGPHREASRK